MSEAHSPLPVSLLGLLQAVLLLAAELLEELDAVDAEHDALEGRVHERGAREAEAAHGEAAHRRAHEVAEEERERPDAWGEEEGIVSNSRCMKYTYVWSLNEYYLLLYDWS